MSFPKNNLNKIAFIWMTFFTMCFLSYGNEIEISAKESMQKAKTSLAQTEELLNLISTASEEYNLMVDLIKQAKKDWDIAVKAYEELIRAKQEISKTDDITLSKAFDKVARVSAQVSAVHADAVTLALSFVELVANDKTVGFEKVGESIDKITGIKDIAIKNRSYIEEVVKDEFTDNDGDGFSNAIEYKGQSDPDDETSTPENVNKLEVLIDADFNTLDQAMNNIVSVSSVLTELNNDLIDTLVASDINDFSIIEDISSNIDNILTLQDGVVDRFDSLIDIVSDLTIDTGEEILNSENELSSLIDAASDVSTSILLGDEITGLDDVDVTFDVLTEDVSDDSSEESVPNIYTDIGQSTGYQETMNTLHDIFRDSSTTVDGGGFGENNATPE